MRPATSHNTSKKWVQSYLQSPLVNKSLVVKSEESPNAANERPMTNFNRAREHATRDFKQAVIPFSSGLEQQSFIVKKPTSSKLDSLPPVLSGRRSTFSLNKKH